MELHISKVFVKFNNILEDNSIYENAIIISKQLV